MIHRYVGSLLVIFLFLVSPHRVAWCGDEHEHGHGARREEPQLTKHSKESLFKLTEKKRFSVEMVIQDQELKKGVNQVDLVIHDSSDKDVTGAEITVTPWMPDMGHGVFEKPEVIEKGRGLYRVENIIVIMAGNWQLKIIVKKGALEDRVVFDFPGMKAPAKARASYIRHKSPAGYNIVLGKENPLNELEPEVITEKGKKIKVFRLTVQDVAIEIHPGTFFEGWGFNGQIPGPTLRIREGDRVRIILTNETNDKHTVHVHGQRKPVVMDGVPYLGQKPVGKGGSFTYEFIAEVPGTTFYHCHVDAAHHMDMGMYGAFIVEPKKETVPYDREYILILDEFPTGHVHVHPGEEMPMKGHEEHGVVSEHKGEAVHEHEGEKPKKRDWYPETYNPYAPVLNTFTINARAFPFTQPLDVKKGERVKIRFINAGFEPHFMHMHAHKFLVTHRDGLPLKEQLKLDTVEVGPGQRVDILLIADNPGIWPFHCHRPGHIANDNIYPGGMLTLIRYVD